MPAVPTQTPAAVLPLNHQILWSGVVDGFSKPIVPRISGRDSVRDRRADAAEEARDDRIERSVPCAAGSDHQHETRAGAARLSHWRKRFGDKLELLLAERLRVAHEAGALRPKDLARVTVDTTVQPKNITFPTDAKLPHAANKELVRLANKRGVRLRQSYLRFAKRAAMMAGRYPMQNSSIAIGNNPRIRLGRIIRDIRRKIGSSERLEAACVRPLSCADQCQRGWKIYCSHGGGPVITRNGPKRFTPIA